MVGDWTDPMRFLLSFPAPSTRGRRLLLAHGMKLDIWGRDTRGMNASTHRFGNPTISGFVLPSQGRLG